MKKVTMTRRQAAAVPLAALLGCAAFALSACGSSSGGGSEKSLALVAYSTPQSAYEKLIPAFQATPEGKGVTFSQSFGASGDQSRAVATGLHADVVNFSLEPDVDTARQGGHRRRRAGTRTPRTAS